MTVREGDELAFCDPLTKQWTTQTVDRVTPTGQVVAGPWRMRPDLTVMGRRMLDPERGQPVTDEIRAAIGRQWLASKIARYHRQWHMMSAQTLRAVLEAIEADPVGKEQGP